MDQLLEWARSNWGETGLAGTWAVLIVRLLWQHGRTWCSQIQQWYRAQGSTKTLGLVKHRDEDDDVIVKLEIGRRSFDIHSSGKFVDMDWANTRSSDQPPDDDSDQTDNHK